MEDDLAALHGVGVGAFCEEIGLEVFDVAGCAGSEGVEVLELIGVGWVADGGVNGEAFV